MTKTLRYAVIGTGMMGVEHIENLKMLDGVAVVATSDPDARSRESGAAAAGPGVEVFADHVTMLDSVDLDAVVIASPNHTHRDVLRDVLARSELHVLVEKPLCTTVEDCRRVEAWSRGRPGLVWVGLEYRYLAPVAQLIERVRAGEIGPVHMVAMREHRFPFLAKVGSWNRFSRNTGGTLVEKCCHFFDLMNLILADAPVRVFASGGQDVNHLDEVYEEGRPDILDNAYVVVDYASGSRAMLDLCMFADATRNQEEIVAVGARGKIEALIPDNVVRVGRRGEHGIGLVDEISVGADEVPHVGLHHGSSWLEHQAFASRIRTGGPADVTIGDGLLSVAMGVAAHRSIAERRVVTLGEVL